MLNIFIKKLLIIIITIVSLIISVPVFAYWEVTYLGSIANKQTKVQIGSFFYGSMKLYSPNDTYSRGSIITKGGKVYIADMTVTPDDPNHNPEIINTNALKGMRYRESTNLYVSYNRYLPSDYVVYGGKTYQLSPPNYHDPNTVRQVSPGDNGQRVWNLVNDSVLNTWYRYKIYYKGDVIQYYGKSYVCLQDECNQIAPSNAQYWYPSG
ncbi:hypothetical protein NC01_09890 [Streptococcus uberis]|nr:hypothetical protein NC01_09890 [Streptococcus uberis]